MIKKLHLLQKNFWNLLSVNLAIFYVILYKGLTKTLPEMASKFSFCKFALQTCLFTAVFRFATKQR